MEVNAVNPLFNSLIIKKVYKYLDFDDKKSFRLVCKPWIDTILDLWRKQTKLGINEKNCYRRNPPPRSADYILEYFNLYKVAEKPFLNLKLFKMQFSFLPEDVFGNARNEKKKFAQMFQTVQYLVVKNFGNFLERLELVDCSFLQDGCFEAGFYHFLLKSFPKLKVLSIQCPKISPSFKRKIILDESTFPRTQSDLNVLNLDGKKFDQDAAKKIFNLMPNLKNLTLHGPVCESLEALAFPLDSSGKHIQLERLGIDHDFDFETLSRIPAWIKNYLEAARPPLKCLKASLLFGAFSPHNLLMTGIQFSGEPFTYKPIWKTVGSSLVLLNLQILPGLWNWCTLFTGYSLPNLTHLRINFRETTESNRELLRFDFGMLRGTPLLQKLDLDFRTRFYIKLAPVETNLEEHELEWRGNAGNELRGPIVLEHLKYFRYELFHKPTDRCWRAFAEMMPNLRKLQGIMDEDTVPLVRQLWPDLKLKWSTVLRQANSIGEYRRDMEGEFIEFGNERSFIHWENWN